MSVLETPRIYFRGEITWDPVTTNNFRQLYDEDKDVPLLPAVPAGAPPGTRREDVFREVARRAVSDGNWNPHGTHRVHLVGVRVSGVDRGAGVQVDDDLVGSVVTLEGKLVDAEPYGANSSQIFFDRFDVGAPGGDHLSMPSIHPVAARWITFGRNTGLGGPAAASVVWQASSATAGLDLDARGSDVLTALAAQLGDPTVRGLTVRFNTYLTMFDGNLTSSPITPQALEDAIRKGGFHPNPARGRVVGVIGLWRPGEAASVPSERRLSGVTGWGAGFARVGADHLALDLANSVQETDVDATKVDVGTISVVAHTGAGEVALGSFGPDRYDRRAYEATSGIVTVPLSAAQVTAASAGQLELRSSTEGTVMAEAAVSITVEPPVVYLDQGDPAQVTVRALVRGAPPGSPLDLAVSIPPGQLTTAADGTAVLELVGGAAGCVTATITVATDPGDEGAYVLVRTLDSPAEVAALEPTWANVYEHVLRNWYAIAPCMDNWLRLDSEAECRKLAPLIKRLTSKDLVERSSYMPVTRDLGRAHRDLLHRWCDAVIAGTDGDADAFVATAAPPVSRPPATGYTPPLEYDEPNPFGRGLGATDPGT